MTGLTTGRALVVRGDALRLPLPDESVDLIVTSPPYFALRSYTDSGEHYGGQIGSEATPQEFLEALWAATAEMVRVLKPAGSIFVNLGDKYAQDEERSRNGLGVRSTGFASGAVIDSETVVLGRSRRGTVPRKSLMLLPERYRIGCVDRLNLIARAVIVWAKPNGLPESVTDRVRRSHEDWVHLVKQPRYYTAIDEIREAHDTAGRPGARTSYKPGQTSGNTLNGHTAKSDAGLPLNPLGKLPGSVWTVPTEPLSVPAISPLDGRPLPDHFAAFCTAWPRRLILGFSPPGICLECDEGRRPVAEGEAVVRAERSERSQGYAAAASAGGRSGFTRDVRWMGERRGILTGSACACPTPDAPTRPSVILDSFGGTGTTALVARALGRIGITVDRSHDYSRLAAWRTTDPRELAKAVGQPRPDRVSDGQEALFA